MCGGREAGKDVELAAAGEGRGGAEIEVELAGLACGGVWDAKGHQGGDVCGAAVFEDLSVGQVVVNGTSPNLVLR